MPSGLEGVDPSCYEHDGGGAHDSLGEILEERPTQKGRETLGVIAALVI